MDTINIKTNFNAIGEYARSLDALHAGELFRAVQDSGKARKENLKRSESVTQVKEGEEESPSIRSASVPGSSLLASEVNHADRRGNLRDPVDRLRSNEEREREEEPYEPTGPYSFRRRTTHMTGESLDFFA